MFFLFNDTATTEIYTLSLHDALPIFTAFFDLPLTSCRGIEHDSTVRRTRHQTAAADQGSTSPIRSEEHTSELQSHVNLVCRLLLEKKKKQETINTTTIQDR